MLQEDSKPILDDDGGVLQPAVDTLKDIAKQPGQYHFIMDLKRRLICQIFPLLGKHGAWRIVHTSVHVVRIVHARNEKAHARGRVT
jgi:hypothetical protein